jgi:hypothetical protein
VFVKPERRSIPLVSVLCALVMGLDPAAAQTSGSIVGRVLDAQTRQPLSGVGIRVSNGPHRSVSGPDGRFVIGAVPPGERDVHAERIGYQPLVIERVSVRAGRAADIRFELTPAAIALPGVVVQAQRVRLIEPEISTTHETVVAREIRELPIDRLDQIVELTTGVSEGHFRGGRVGQEVYVVDGLSLKNQFEASTAGFGLELAPTSLEEIDVITGGFGAAYGSALSGVVSYSTRRGNPLRWDGRFGLSSDHWAPSSLLRGFVGWSASAGGPLPWLGRGTTLFVDLLTHGYLDADPRAAGLSCIDEAGAEGTLRDAIRGLRSDEQTTHLVCPYSSEMFPHQQGDKYIGFVRIDRPLTPNLQLTASLLRNRLQRQLYTSEFKYNPTYQLGQRSAGTLANLSAEWVQQRAGSARSVNARVALLRLDRYLGVLDPESFGDRFQLGGFSPSNFEFLGEAFVRQPIEEQLRIGSAVPGYSLPGGTTGSPFGPAAAGIFFTAGTPTLANWTRSDLLATDLVASFFSPSGSAYRTGASVKLYRVETYERAFAHLAGSIPNYARFFPGTYSGFAEADIATDDGMHFQFGLRVEAFRSGIDFRFDRADFLSPIVETGWKVSFLPRLGVAFPIPGTEGRTAIRFNFGRVAQPPDFQYFLDSTIGDSLRTDVRRQGNPDLAFEAGSSYEVGFSHMFDQHVALSFTAFRKNLDNLVTGSVRAGELGTSGQFSTSDFGSVKGLEVALRGRWPGLTARGGWALQKATGLTSGLDSDSALVADPALTEYPLAFDRRHSVDVAIIAGRAAGAGQPWTAALTSTLQSGYPLFNPRAPADTAPRNPLLPPMPRPIVRDVALYLPWTWTADLRVSWDLGARLCGRCSWRALADGRNIFNRKNIIALRRETRSLTPTFAEVQNLALSGGELPEPIPRESPSYSQLIDLNHDGLITAAEYRTARLAAAIDRYDPSLYYGESRQLRLGIEVTF